MPKFFANPNNSHWRLELPWIILFDWEKSDSSSKLFASTRLGNLYDLDNKLAKFAKCLIPLLCFTPHQRVESTQQHNQHSQNINTETLHWGSSACSSANGLDTKEFLYTRSQHKKPSKLQTKHWLNTCSDRRNLLQIALEIILALISIQSPCDFMNCFNTFDLSPFNSYFSSSVMFWLRDRAPWWAPITFNKYLNVLQLVLTKGLGAARKTSEN